MASVFFFKPTATSDTLGRPRQLRNLLLLALSVPTSERSSDPSDPGPDNYSDIVSDIPSGSIFIYIYLYLFIYLYLYLFIYIFICRYSDLLSDIFLTFWHSIWHLLFIIDVLSGIYSDILELAVENPTKEKCEVAKYSRKFFVSEEFRSSRDHHTPPDESPLPLWPGGSQQQQSYSIWARYAMSRT